MWHSRPPRDPPPFMANAILNFHFDFLTPSLIVHMFLNLALFFVTVLESVVYGKFLSASNSNSKVLLSMFLDLALQFNI